MSLEQTSVLLMLHLFPLSAHVNSVIHRISPRLPYPAILFAVRPIAVSIDILHVVWCYTAMCVFGIVISIEMIR